jgi:hypothetical protein
MDFDFLKQPLGVRRILKEGMDVLQLNEGSRKD